MTHHRKRLDRTSVLLGARQVLDETGLDGFTTRALAAHLQVQQPGLYWHFRTKAELLAALASDVLDREHHASGSVAKIVKLEHAWRRLDGRNDDGFQVAPFPG